jgi:hypothetical protein
MAAGVAHVSERRSSALGELWIRRMRMQLRLLCPEELGAAEEIDFVVCGSHLIDRVAAF